MSGGGASLRHRHFATCPGARLFNRPARTVIIGLFLLEEMQHMLRAIRCPQRNQAMVGVLQEAAAPYGNQPGISNLAKNHLPPSPCAIAQREDTSLYIMAGCFRGVKRRNGPVD